MSQIPRKMALIREKCPSTTCVLLIKDYINNTKYNPIVYQMAYYSHFLKEKGLTH